MNAKDKSQKLIENFIDKKNVFAVVGVSKNPEKYGHKIYFELKNAGYEVYPINPNADEILGNKCYPSLYDLPKKPDVVDIVVPPTITKKVVKDCHKLNINNVWMQPGSESKEAIESCEKYGIDVLHGVCVMIEVSK